MKKDTLLTDVVERIAKRDTCLYITNKHDWPLPDFADRKVDSRKFMVHLETFADDNQPRLTDQSPRNVMLPMLNEQCTSTFVVSLRERVRATHLASLLEFLTWCAWQALRWLDMADVTLGQIAAQSGGRSLSDVAIRIKEGDYAIEQDVNGW